MNKDKILEKPKYVGKHKIQIPIEIVSKNDIKWYVKGYIDGIHNIPLSLFRYKFHWQRNWMSYSWGHENYHAKTITQKEYFIQKTNDIKTAVTKLCQSLKEDESYYISWKSNIAMAFYDEFYKTYPDNELAQIHTIANTAADNFLKLLINQNK
jgi:hypothetical protein